jgi:hypothetical protein
VRERLAVAAGAIVAIALLWGFTAAEFHYADDWLNFALANERGLSWTLLKEGYAGTFAPGHRFLDWLHASLGDADWNLARALLLAMYAASVAVFWLLVRALVASRAWALAATLLFAFSVTFVRLVEWWASGAHVVPATLFTLVTLWAGVRYLQTRALPWAGLAGAAQALGLCFYSKPLLAGVYLLALLVLFLLPQARSARTIGEGVLRAWPLWVALAVPGLVYLLIITGPAYGPPEGSATLEQWSQYLRATWLRGIAPQLLAQNVPGSTTTLNEVAVVAAQLVVLALVALSLLRSRLAWRAWAFLAVAAIPNVVLVGVGRLHLFGPQIGQDLRYEAEFAFLLPLTLALAFTVPPRPAALYRRLASLPLRPALAVLAAAYLAAYVGTLDRVTDEWPGEGARRYVENMRGDIGRLRAQAPEQRLAVLDATLPFELIAGQGPPHDRLFGAMPEIDPDVAVNRPGRLLVAQPDGHLAPARVLPRDERTPAGSARCLAPDGDGFITWRPRSGPGPEQPLLLRAEADPQPAARILPLLVDRGGGMPGGPDRDASFEERSNQAITELGATSVTELRLQVPAGMDVCIRRLELAGYAPAS